MAQNYSVDVQLKLNKQDALSQVDDIKKSIQDAFQIQDNGDGSLSGIATTLKSISDAVNKISLKDFNINITNAAKKGSAELDSLKERAVAVSEAISGLRDAALSSANASKIIGQFLQKGEGIKAYASAFQDLTQGWQDSKSPIDKIVSDLEKSSISKLATKRLTGELEQIMNAYKDILGANGVDVSAILRPLDELNKVADGAGASAKEIDRTASSIERLIKTASGLEDKNFAQLLPPDSEAFNEQFSKIIESADSNIKSLVEMFGGLGEKLSNAVSLTPLEDKINSYKDTMEGLLSSLEEVAERIERSNNRINRNRLTGEDRATYKAQTTLFDNMYASSAAPMRELMKNMGSADVEANIGEIVSRYDAWLQKIQQVKAAHEVLTDEERNALRAEGEYIINNANTAVQAINENRRLAEAESKAAAQAIIDASKNKDEKPEKIVSNEIASIQRSLGNYFKNIMKISDADVLKEQLGRYDEVKSKVDALAQSFQDGVLSRGNLDTGIFDEYISKISQTANEVNQLGTEWQSLARTDSNSGFSNIIKGIDKLRNSLNSVKDDNTFGKLKADIDAFENQLLTGASLENTDELIREAQIRVNELGAAIKDALKQQGTIDPGWANGLISEADKVNEALRVVRDNETLNVLSQKLADLQASIRTTAGEADTDGSKMRTYAKELEAISVAANEAINKQNEMAKALSAESINDPSHKINALLSSFGNSYIERGSVTALTGEWEALKREINEARNATNQSFEGRIPEFTQRVEELQLKTIMAKNAVAGLSASGETLSGVFGRALAMFSGYALVMKIFNKCKQAISSIVTQIKDLDLAMTELRKVTDLTETAYSDFYNKIAGISKQIGATVSDTINSTADFARLGYGIVDSTQLAQSALIYKNVGDGIGDVSEATESLISTMKAFKVEAADSIDIVNMFNEVGNNFAISSSGIGEALIRSASALAGAGNSLEESIGLIAAGNEIIQNPESLGTALKTLTMYLRASKTELEAAGEDTEGMASSVSKLRAELKLLTGVDIMKTSDEYKSTYQILKELSKVWGSLSDISQANVTNLIGGKRNANTIQAILTNFEQAEKASNAALHSENSAMRENEKVLDSIAGRTAVLNASWQEFSTDFLGSGVVKGWVSTLTSITNALDWFIKRFSTIPVIASTVVGAITAATKTLNAVGVSNGRMTLFGGLLHKGDPLNANYMDFGAGMGSNIITTFFKQFSAGASGATLQAINLQNALNAGTIGAEQFQAGLTSLGFTEEQVAAAMQSGVYSIDKFGAAAAGAKIQVGLLSGAAKVASIALSMIATTVVIGAITGIITAIKNATGVNEELINKTRESIDSFNDADRTYKKNSSRINELSERYNELSKGVGENNENISLTSDEYEEYLSICNEVRDISPDLVKAYNNKGDAILLYRDNLHLATEELQKLHAEEEKEYYSESHLSELWKGYGEENKKIGAERKESLTHSIASTLENGNIQSRITPLFKELGIWEDGRTTEEMVGDHLKQLLDMDPNALAAQISQYEYDYGAVIAQARQLANKAIESWDTENREGIDEFNPLFGLLTRGANSIIDINTLGGKSVDEITQSFFDAIVKDITSGTNNVARVLRDSAAYIDTAMYGELMKNGDVSPLDSWIEMFSTDSADKVRDYFKDAEPKMSEAANILYKSMLYDKDYQEEMGTWSEQMSDEFISALTPSIDLSSYSESKKAADKLYQQIKELYQNPAAVAIDKVARNAKTREDLTEFNRLIGVHGEDLLKKGYDENLVSVYLNGFIETANEAFTASEASESVARGADSMAEAASVASRELIGLSDALSKYNSAMDFTRNLKSDKGYNKFGLSANDISEMSGLLEDGENIYDYLLNDNGMLKINEEKWSKRNEDILNKEIETYQGRITQEEERRKEAYHKIFELSEKAQEATNKGFDSETQSWFDLNAKRNHDEIAKDISDQLRIVDDANAKIAGYQRDIGMYQTGSNNAVFDTEALFGDLDRVSSDAQKFIDLYDDVGDTGLKLSDLGEILEDYPDLAKQLISATPDNQRGIIRDFIFGKDGSDGLQQEYQKVYTDWIANAKKAVDAMEDGEAKSAFQSIIDVISGLSETNFSDAIGWDKATVNVEQIEEVTSRLKDYGTEIADLQKKRDEMNAVDGVAIKESEWWKLGGEYPGLYATEGFADAGEDIAKQTAVLDAYISAQKAYSDAVIDRAIAENQEKIESGEATAEEVKSLENVNASLKALKSTDVDYEKVYGTESAKEASGAYDTLSQSLSNLNTVSNAISSMRAQGASFQDKANGVIDLLQMADKVDGMKGKYKFADFFKTGTDEIDSAKIESFVDSLIELSPELATLRDTFGIDNEAIKNFYLGIVETKSAVDALNDAISNAQTIGNLVEGINKGSATDFEILDDVISLCADGKHEVSDFITSFDAANGVTWNVNAMEAALDDALKPIQELEDANPEKFGGLTASIKQQVLNADEAKNAFDQFTDAVSKAQSAYGLLGSLNSIGGIRTGEDMFSVISSAVKIAEDMGVSIGEILNSTNGYLSIDADAVKSWGVSWINSLEGVDSATKQLMIADLDKSLKIEDPYGLNEIDNQIDSAMKNARTIDEAIKQIEQSKKRLTYSEVADLVGNAPEISKAGDLLGADSVEAQLSILQAARAADETDFKKYCANRISELSRQKAEFEAAGVEVPAELENQSKFWVSMFVGGFGEAFKKASTATLEDASNFVTKYHDIMSTLGDKDVLAQDKILEIKELTATASEITGIDFDFRKMFYTDENGVVQTTAAFENMKDVVIEASLANEDLGESGEAVRAGLQSASTGIEKYSTTISDAFSTAKGVQDFITSFGSADFDLLDAVETAQGFADTWNSINNLTGDNKVDASKFLNFDVVGGTVAYAEEALNALTEAQFDAAFAGTKLAQENPELIKQFKEYAVNTAAAERGLQRFSNMLSSISDVKGFLTSAEGGNEDQLGLLQEAASLAESTGKSISDFVTFSNGQFARNEDAAYNWALGAIDDFAKVSGATDEMVEAYKALILPDSRSSKFNIESETTSISNLNNAIQESYSATGLTAESIKNLVTRYKELDSFNYGDLFRYTASGVGLNADEVQRLEGEYEKMRFDKLQQQAADLQSEYQSLTEQINNCSDAEERAALIEQRNSLDKRIYQVAELSSQYSALTSAYNKWKNAQSNGESGDMYDDVMKLLESSDELKKKGLVGTNEFAAAAQFLSYEDLSGKSIDEIVSAYTTGRKTAKRWFTDSSKGSKNFLTDLSKATDANGNNMNWAKKDKNGVWSLAFDIDEVAKHFGTSTDAIMAMIGKLKDRGIRINIDPLTSGLDTVKQDAKEANERLIQLGKSHYRFNFDTTDVEVLDTEIEQALKELAELRSGDGEIPVDTEDLEDAEKILTALIRKKQQLEQPAIMNVNPSNVGGTTGGTGVIDKVQEYIKAKQDLDLANQLGEDNVLGIDISEAEAKVSQIRQEITGILTGENGEEIKAELGLKDDAGKSLLTQIENLNPEVLATLKINGNEGEDESGQTISVTAELDDSAIKAFEAESHDMTAKVTYKRDSSDVDNYNPKNLTRTVLYKTYTEGNQPGKPSDVFGTANVSGSAFAHGNWGLSGSGVALGGELGQEIVVRNGRFFTVGDNGAEMFKYKPGDIVFNAEQTRNILKYGGTKGAKPRGRMLAIGTAFASASGGGKLYEDTAAKKTTKKSSSSGSSSSGSSKIQKLLDKYQKMIDQFEHLIEHQKFLYDEAEYSWDYGGMAASLEEQARIYRDIIAKAQTAISDMKKAGAKDTTKELQEMEETMWDAYRNLYSTLDELNEVYVQKLNDKIDSVQDSYANLSEALGEIARSGNMSVDTFQAVLEGGIEYLDLLEMQNGQYTLNEEKVNDMIAAEKEQLAIEQALSYLSSIFTALYDKDLNKLDGLIDATEKFNDATWESVYAQAESLKMEGLNNDQYIKIINNIDKLRDLTGTVVRDITEKDVLEQDAEAIDRILELTKDLIRYENDEQIEALETQIEDYNKLIDLKRKMLDKTREEADYQKDVAERVKEIAESQAKIDKLALDDSREAQAERLKLMEELKDMQDDLAQSQADHSYDAQNEALDKASEDYEEATQKEIDALEERLSSEEKLYQEAIERIKTRWDDLYKNLIDWNYDAGSILNSEVTDNWELALKRAQEYGDYIKALSGVYDKIVQSGDENENLKYIVENLPKYHSGGVVGDAGSINAHEAVAILEKGEIVLDKQKQNGLYRLIDFNKTLGERLGVVINDISSAISAVASPIVNEAKALAKNIVSNNNSTTFSPSINVTINHSGSMTDIDAESYGRKIADTALDKLYNAFERRGITSMMAGTLK